MQKQMEELRQSEKDIAPVLKLIALLQERCAGNASVSAEIISLVLSTWKECLSDKSLRPCIWDGDISKNAQYIDIRHTVYGDHERKMIFSIEDVKRLIETGVLRAHREKLSEIVHILHCANASHRRIESKNLSLSDNDPYPPTAIFLPADSYTLELIDGNHRADLAKRSGTDLSIFVVDNFVMPPQAFLGLQSWATYNILSGVYYLQLPEFVRRLGGPYTTQFAAMLQEYRTWVQKYQ